MASPSSSSVNLEDIHSMDLMTELLRRMKCSTKPDKRLILIGKIASFLSLSLSLSLSLRIFHIQAHMHKLTSQIWFLLGEIPWDTLIDQGKIDGFWITKKELTDKKIEM